MNPQNTQNNTNPTQQAVQNNANLYGSNFVAPTASSPYGSYTASTNTVIPKTPVNPIPDGSALDSTTVNTTPSSNQIRTANPISISSPSLASTSTDRALSTTVSNYMASPPTPSPYYDSNTGFLTPAGKAAGQPAVQPNDPSGGTNNNSAINSYLGSGSIVPDTSGNANNTLLTQYQNLNNQLATETSTRNDLNTKYGVDSSQTNYINAYNAYNQAQLQSQQQIEALYHQPGVTMEQAQQSASDITRENNANLANLAVVAQASQGLYQNAMDIVQRKMDAQFQPVQAQIDNLKSIVQSPNSNLTASQTAQINANMFGLQNNLTNTKNALSTGSQTLIQNGLYTADIGKQLDAAQTPEQVNSIVSQAMTGAGLSYNQSGTSGGSGTSNLNTQEQQYTASTSSGDKYVPQTKLVNLTPFQQQQFARDYANAGIPVLDADQTLKIQNIDVTQQNLAGLQNVINGQDVTTGKQGSPLLGSGVTGRIGSSISNFVGNLTQSNPNIAAFNNYRLTAINTLQSLGAGSGGSRITASEIATAVSNLPTLTDNMETAQAKLSIVDGFLTKWTHELLPQGSSSGSSAGGSGLYDW